MSIQCELRDQPAQPVLSIRTMTSVERLPQEIARAYGAIAAYLGELGQAPAGVPFVGYYNMDMQALDVEIGFPTAGPLPGRGEIAAGEIAAGKQATCLYVGPYEQMAQPYEALTQFMKEQGLTPSGISYEFYFNDPSVTPAAELRTLIVFPVGS